MTPVASAPAAVRRPAHQALYLWVIAGLVAGAVLGLVDPQLAERMKPLADGFIALIKMLVAPIIFCTVVVGLASLGSLRQVGRVGVKALLYFEVATTAALLIGLVVADLVRPGGGIGADPGRLDPSAVQQVRDQAEQAQGAVKFFLTLIPDTFLGAFARGNIVQVLGLAVLFAVALASTGRRGKPVLDLIDRLGHVFFALIRLVMYVAPLGAFGGMAFTVGAFGLGTLRNLAVLIVTFYATCLAFVLVVLGLVARLHGFSLLRLLRYLKDELLIVLGTSSSESVLPRLLRKLELAGVSRPVVGLTVPSGYSFNLVGTSLYLTLAALFVAQATGTDLTPGQQLFVLGVLLLTSKAATGVTGSGLVTLAATLATINTIPLVGVALLVGIDRFMSEARALTNFVGNAVAPLVVASWEGELDRGRLRQVLAGEVAVDMDGPDADDETVIVDTFVVEDLDPVEPPRRSPSP